MRRTFLLGICSVAVLACSKPELRGDSGDTPAPPQPTVTKPEPPAVKQEHPPVDMPDAAAVSSAAAASNAFALDLWARAGRTSVNLAVSPASIVIALAMTWGGARGETAAQMQAVLHQQADAEASLPAWGTLSGALQDPRRTLQLRIANRLFGEQSFTFEAPFIARTAELFAAPLQTMDFKGAAEPARVEINQWVATQTEDRIRDLLPERSITAQTRMVLVNAIYFLADWAQQFEKERTSARPFSLTATQTKPVQTMHQMAYFRLAKGDGVRVLELPYVAGEAAMWIVLPDAVDGLPGVEQVLTPAVLEQWRGSLTRQNVSVALPRFTIDPATPLELSEALAALGMPLAFDGNRADFTGIGVPPDPRNRLYVSAVYHKAFVKVDEKGTEAAAATAVVMAEGAGMPPKAEAFVVDRPFLFFIVDDASGLVLFMGRVVDPV